MVFFFVCKFLHVLELKKLILTIHAKAFCEKIGHKSPDLEEENKK
jgi:hypothetical protein